MTPQPQPQQDKDLDIIRDYIIMASDWEAQQEMALDALHRIRSRPTPSPDKPRPPCEECIYQAQAAQARPAPSPCEAQGCTDIEQCDEICEHQRMYTPVMVKNRVEAARTEERNKILRLVESDEWQREHDEETRNTVLDDVTKMLQCRGLFQIDIARDIESLRTPTPKAGAS